jgi:hypothetical protein
VLLEAASSLKPLRSSASSTTASAAFGFLSLLLSGSGQLSWPAKPSRVTPQRSRSQLTLAQHHRLHPGLDERRELVANRKLEQLPLPNAVVEHRAQQLAVLCAHAGLSPSSSRERPTRGWTEEYLRVGRLPDPHPEDVADVVRGAVQFLSPELKAAAVRVVLELHEGLPLVAMARAQMREVLRACTGCAERLRSRAAMPGSIHQLLRAVR